MATYPNYNSMPKPNANMGAPQINTGPSTVDNPFIMGKQQQVNPMFGNPGQSNDPRMGMPNYYQYHYNQNPTTQNYQKFQGAMDAQMLRNPFTFQQQTMDSYQNWMNDPNLGGGYKQQMDQAYNQLGQATRGYAGGLGGLQRMAQGKDSVVARQAQVQRQHAMGDIAQQAAMQGAAGNPALARQAVMQQANMGQNMAGQIAAMRAQEKQQAQMAYMQALQGNVGNYGNMYNAANQMYGQAQTGWGAVNNSGFQAQAQAASGINQNEKTAGNVRG